MSSKTAIETGVPTITETQVIPVAGHDSMLLNPSGANSPYFTRNIWILGDSYGHVSFRGRP